VVKLNDSPNSSSVKLSFSYNVFPFSSLISREKLRRQSSSRQFGKVTVTLRLPIRSCNPINEVPSAFPIRLAELTTPRFQWPLSERSPLLFLPFDHYGGVTSCFFAFKTVEHPLKSDGQNRPSLTLTNYKSPPRS